MPFLIDVWEEFKKDKYVIASQDFQGMQLILIERVHMQVPRVNPVL